MLRRDEKKFDFLGLFTEEISGKKNKSNGAIILNGNKILIEKRSRLNGKLKDSYEIDCDDLAVEDIDRPAINRIEIDLKDRKISLKTLDHEMLDHFEDKLLNIIEGPKIRESAQNIEDSQISSSSVIESSSKNEIKSDSAISEIDIPDQIRKYHDLYKEGIISEEEFENKKKELLNS